MLKIFNIVYSTIAIIKYKFNYILYYSHLNMFLLNILSDWDVLDPQ